MFYDNANVLALSEAKLNDIFFIGRFKIPALWASFGRHHDQFGGRGFTFLRMDEPVKHLSSEVTHVKGIYIELNIHEKNFLLRKVLIIPINI